MVPCIDLRSGKGQIEEAAVTVVAEVVVAVVVVMTAAAAAAVVPRRSARRYRRSVRAKRVGRACTPPSRPRTRV